jgi:hypothetical protein
MCPSGSALRGVDKEGAKAALGGQQNKWSMFGPYPYKK